MGLFGVSLLCGGLALFLCGMRLMDEGLAGISGGWMKKILGKLAGSPGKSVLAGAVVTAVVQSSSAVIVVVVGLVGSGDLALWQAADIIMGANIGTTATSWILGAVGRRPAGAAFGALRPAVLGFLAALAGGMLWVKKEKRRSAVYTLTGFAVLLSGMDTMSRAAEPLIRTPGFVGLLTRISGPLPGVLTGICVTALLQSSSASIGMLQALCNAGAMDYGTVLPILLGQNIGTCVTALLSGIGKGRNARCAALLHLNFNVAGTAIFLALFYAAKGIFPGVLSKPADGLGIALAHSVFNLTTTVILLPFLGCPAKIHPSSPSRKALARDPAASSAPVRYGFARSLLPGDGSRSPE